MKWMSIAPEAGSTETGTEGGVIVRDDVHDDGARITLEKLAGETNYAITCGIYDWMVHTRFFNTKLAAYHAFEAMKNDMDAIIAAIPLKNDPERERKMDVASQTMSRFVDKYPS